MRALNRHQVDSSDTYTFSDSQVRHVARYSLTLGVLMGAVAGIFLSSMF